jgi:hypothetical protein
MLSRKHTWEDSRPDGDLFGTYLCTDEAIDYDVRANPWSFRGNEFLRPYAALLVAFRQMVIALPSSVTY